MEKLNNKQKEAVVKALRSLDDSQYHIESLLRDAGLLEPEEDALTEDERFEKILDEFDIDSIKINGVGSIELREMIKHSWRNKPKKKEDALAKARKKRAELKSTCIPISNYNVDDKKLYEEKSEHFYKVNSVESILKLYEQAVVDEKAARVRDVSERDKKIEELAHRAPPQERIESMKPWNKRTTAAIEKSIAHWERMIKHAKKFDEYGSPHKYNMHEAIGEEWRAVDCALCKLFISEDCAKCPLELNGNGCCDSDSPWDKVDNTDTWREWLVNAKVMLKTLKGLRKGRPA